MIFNGRMAPQGGMGPDNRQFPMPIPPSSINTSYSPTGINSTVQVPGAAILPNNLDRMLMEALTRPGPAAPARRPVQAAPPPMMRGGERQNLSGTGAGNAIATNSGDIAMSPMGTLGQMTPYGFKEHGASRNFSWSPTVAPDRWAAPGEPNKWKMHSGGVNMGGQLGGGNSAAAQLEALLANGPGAAFEARRMGSALERSNAEYAARQQK